MSLTKNKKIIDNPASRYEYLQNNEEQEQNLIIHMCNKIRKSLLIVL